MMVEHINEPLTSWTKVVSIIHECPSKDLPFEPYKKNRDTQIRCSHLLEIEA